ncbi:MAG: acyl-ACP--UDP-N-acetylglucosamine O-acyltransferase [Minicystis sp.]
MSAASIHPTAVVAPDATLGAGVSVGPFAIVEAGVQVGEGTRVDAHAILRSGTRLGARNVVHPFAVIGGDPQERTYAGEPTRLEIGDGNVFREHVTVHRGSPKGGGLTRIGSGCLFMAGVHVAHDCLVGDRIELANGTLLAGHVIVGDFVVAGGGVAVAPFVRVGSRAFLAAGAMVERDVPPFVIAAGDRARVRALNRVGLQRSGVPEASRAALERAFRLVFRGDAPRAVAAAALADDPDPFVRELAAALAE